AGGASPAPDEGGAEPRAAGRVWKKVRRNLLFWQAARDTVQVSVFAPPVEPGQTVRLSVFLHTPEAADSVRTLSRAFHHDAELVGTGCLAREFAHGSALAVHVSVANAAISKARLDFEWRGQPHKLAFDLYIPWECTGGRSPGVVSVGQKDVRVGKIEFALTVLPRRA
ncbi:MAG: hypothetical protein ACKODX_10345, partial [Gemmata sp.]